MAGFEPAASCSQSRRATKLRHIPLDRSVAYRPDRYAGRSVTLAVARRAESAISWHSADGLGAGSA